MSELNRRGFMASTAAALVGAAAHVAPAAIAHCPRIITAHNHPPCKVYDAHGDLCRYVTQVNLDTGEAEQYVRHADGKYELTADGKSIVRRTVGLAMPIRIVPILLDREAAPCPVN